MPFRVLSGYFPKLDSAPSIVVPKQLTIDRSSASFSVSLLTQRLVPRQPETGAISVWLRLVLAVYFQGDFIGRKDAKGRSGLIVWETNRDFDVTKNKNWKSSGVNHFMQFAKRLYDYENKSMIRQRLRLAPSYRWVESTLCEDGEAWIRNGTVKVVPRSYVGEYSSYPKYR